MLNNKGFAVSSVLYTLLISFLMFLGATLAMFSSSSTLIGKANDDLVNGTQFKVTQVKPAEGRCVWYDSSTIVQIKSRYGTKYWPKDFEVSEKVLSKDQEELTPEKYKEKYYEIQLPESKKIISLKSSGKINVNYDNSTISNCEINEEGNCVKDEDGNDISNSNYPGYTNYGKLTFTDDGNKDSKSIILVDICE